MKTMLIFGLGYSAQAVARDLRARGWRVEATGRAGTLDFADDSAVRAAMARADAVLSSVPPADGVDPVLARYGDALRASWLGYLSSTGVYGDAQGAWVDESAPIGQGRRSARAVADADWQARGARVFRLPGIYGPGRSAFDRIKDGRAHRIDLPEQIFSRIHVDDIASGVVAALDAPSGIYNLADDLPASQNAVIEEACRLLRRAPPPLQTLAQANLGAKSAAFYAENRRVANGKARRVLGWTPRYASFREGLSAIIMPAMATTDPATDSPVQT